MPTIAVDATRELASEGVRLHLHQLVRVHRLGGGEFPTRVPRHYVVTDLDDAGGVRFVAAPITDESPSVTLSPGIVARLAHERGLTPLFHGEIPEWGY